MKERVNFVLEWERRWNETKGGKVGMGELCRKCGVSRPTGFAAAAYQPASDFGDGRRPGGPGAQAPEHELDRKHRAASGLCRLKKRRRHLRPQTQPFAATEAPNDSTPTPAICCAPSRCSTRPATTGLRLRQRARGGDVQPALVYRRSPGRYLRKLRKPEPPSWRDACDVDRNGCIRWRKAKIFVSSALAHELVELEGVGEWIWQIGLHKRRDIEHHADTYRSGGKAADSVRNCSCSACLDGLRLD